MNTRHSRLLLSVCALLSAGGGFASVALFGCGDDSATSKSDAAAPSPTSTAANDGGSSGSSSGDSPLGDPPGTPGDVLAASTLVTTFAGSGTPGFADGNGAKASFHSPAGVGLNKTGAVYVADSANNAVRVISPTGDVTTIAGGGPDAGGFADNQANKSRFDGPAAVVVDDKGNVYVADPGNDRVRIVAKGNTNTLLAADAGEAGPAVTGAVFNGPKGVAVIDTTLYVADTASNNIRYIALDTKIVAPVAGSSTPGFAEGSGTAASFHTPTSVTVDSNGIVFVADSENHRIRRIEGAAVTTPAGSGTAAFADGTGAAASFNTPSGVAVDANGNVFIADSLNNRIRKMTPAGVVTTIAGDATSGSADGPVATARFNRPTGIAVDTNGYLYVSDTDNHRIRRIFTVGAGQLLVTWSLPTSGGAVTGFKVTATAAGQPDATCSTTAATMCTLSGLTSGVKYSITVVAMSGTKVGTPSAAVDGTAQ